MTTPKLDLAVRAMRDEPVPAPRFKSRRNEMTPFLLPATAALALVVLWPRANGSEAFARALDQSRNAPRTHTIMRFSGGEPGMERWTEGKKSALLLYDHKGLIISELRFDGTRLAKFFRMPYEKRTVNSFRYARIDRSTRTPGLGPTTSLDGLLREYKGKVLEGPVVSDEGDRYRVRTSGRMGVIDVLTEANGGRIRRIASRESGWTEVTDYPERIDPDVFAPRIRAVANIRTFDGGTLGRDFDARVRRGLGATRGVVLRALTLSAEGSVGAVWSERRGSRGRFTLPGVPVEERVSVPGGLGAGLAHPTLGWLRAESVTPTVRIGTRLTVRIGTTEFRNIPVQRIDALRYRLSPLHPRK